MTETLNTYNMRLLVTGGAGFIGSNFCHHWNNKYPHSTIVVLDLLTYAGNKNNLKTLENKENFIFIKGDINDRELVEKLIKENNINTIVNFAAESHVDRSIHDPSIFLKTNTIGTHTLLEVARKVWIDGSNHKVPHRFHHISTDEVYGTLGPKDLPFTEDSPYAPNSPYAASKAASDHLVRAYNKTYGLCTSISNCSNNYGPYQFPEKLIPLIILNILHNRPLPIYGDGQQIRDWLYVEDHCQGICLILDKGQAGSNYNIGGNNEYTNLDLVKCICSLLDNLFIENKELQKQYPLMPICNGKSSLSLIHYVKDRPGHDRRYAIDSSKFDKELNYKPKHSFEEGIIKTINWYLENSDWYKPLLEEQYNDWIKKQYGDNFIS